MFCLLARFHPTHALKLLRPRPRIPIPMHSLVFLLLACLGLALADPTPPGYSYLYTVNATLAPAIDIGPGPLGNRVAIPITGGEFTGPKLKGELFFPPSTATACWLFIFPPTDATPFPQARSSTSAPTGA